MKSPPIKSSRVRFVGLAGNSRLALICQNSRDLLDIIREGCSMYVALSLRFDIPLVCACVIDWKKRNVGETMEMVARVGAKNIWPQPWLLDSGIYKSTAYDRSFCTE